MHIREEEEPKRLNYFTVERWWFHFNFLTRSDDLTAQTTQQRALKLLKSKEGKKPADDFLSRFTCERAREIFLPVFCLRAVVQCFADEGKNFSLSYSVFVLLLVPFSPSLACYEPFLNSIRSIRRVERNSQNSFIHARDSSDSTFSHAPCSYGEECVCRWGSKKTWEL